MPGYELIGSEELGSINEIFSHSRGVLFAHGFESLRNGRYRVREFEAEIAKQFNCLSATAVSSGTAAGLVALKAIGVGPGDEVITQAFTFIATVEAILMSGATPVVVDCDETFNMCPIALQKALSPKTKCIMPVHMLGSSARINEIVSIAKKHKLSVIEDACQAFGGSYLGKPLGTFGDMGFFSLDFGKLITTGEGGLIITNNNKYHEFASAYHDHGHQNLPNLSRGNDIASCIGFNFRMTELQAAIGLVQLKRLEYILKKNRSHKTFIKSQLQKRYGDSIEFRKILDEEGDTAEALVFSLPNEKIAINVTKDLESKGIGSKNIPSALNWHYAGLWHHVWKSHSTYHNCYTSMWKRTGNLLKRSIAIGIMINMTNNDIEKLLYYLTQAIDAHLVAA